MQDPLPQWRSILRRQLVISSIGSVLCFALCLLVCVQLLAPQLATEILPQGQGYLVAIVFAFWAWVLRSQPGILRRVWADYKTAKVKEISGVLAIETGRGIGIIAPQKRVVWVGGERLAGPVKEGVRAFIGQPVKATVSETAKILLSLDSVAENVVPESEKSVFPDDLTARDLTLLTLLARGHSDKVIARELDLSPATVRTYNSSLFKKLGISSRSQAGEVAQRMGLSDVN